MTADISSADWFTRSSTRTVLAALDAVDAGGSRFVGGCVRNTLLGEPVSDIDIATRLTPEQTIAALSAAGIRAIPTGIEHGTVTGVCDHEPFDITTLRRDVETDGRRAVVAFTRDWAEDAMRRDFRMNALYADTAGQIHDPTGGGLSDIESRRIVFIGKAEDRLREDHLRNLRFFRFSAWYGRGLDAEGLAACGALKDGLDIIAAERIWKELLKLLDAPSPYEAVDAMHACGVLDVILPENQSLDRLKGLARVEARSGKAFGGMERFITLLAPDEEAMRELAIRLRLSGLERDRLIDFTQAIDAFSPDMSVKAAKEAIYRTGNQTSLDVLLWQWAGALTPEWQDLFELCQSWERPVFPVRGADLIRAGVSPGPELGERLRKMEDAWIANDYSMDGL